MSEKYYSQDNLWGRCMFEYQLQVLQSLLYLIPQDVETILDIGCGDGYITNSLTQRFDVTGMNISEEALAYLQCKTVVENVAQIPFENHSFDLVMLNDVIEHLPSTIYELALSEIARVTKKYIFVTVPLEENLTSKTLLCPQCGTAYHYNWHQRRFTVKDVQDLLRPLCFDCAAVVLTGGINLPPIDPTASFRQALHLNNPSVDTLCPSCSTPFPRQNHEDPVTLLDIVRQNAWTQKETYKRTHNRSEIMGLYAANTQAKAKTFLLDLLVENAPTKSGLLNYIDFSNPLQHVINLTQGNRLARYVVHQEESGFDNKTGGKERILFNFSVYTFFLFLLMVFCILTSPSLTKTQGWRHIALMPFLGTPFLCQLLSPLSSSCQTTLPLHSLVIKLISICTATATYNPLGWSRRLHWPTPFLSILV